MDASSNGRVAHWRAALDVLDPGRRDGHERTESARTSSYEDAKRLLTKRLAAGDDGSYIDAERERLTVGEVLERVVVFYELQGHRSLETVRSHVRRLAAALGPRRRALEVTTGLVQHVLQRWRAEEFSPATCNRRVAILRRRDRLASFASIRPPRLRRPLPPRSLAARPLHEP